MYATVSAPCSSFATAEAASETLWQAEAPCRRPKGIARSTKLSSSHTTPIIGQSSGSPRSCLYALLRSILYRQHPGPFFTISAARSRGLGSFNLKGLPSSASLGIPLLTLSPWGNDRSRITLRLAESLLGRVRRGLLLNQGTNGLLTKGPAIAPRDVSLSRYALTCVGFLTADEWFFSSSAGTDLET